MAIRSHPLGHEAVGIVQRAFGMQHPHVATTCESYAVVLAQLGRRREAAEMHAWAQAVREAHARHNPPGSAEQPDQQPATNDP